MAYISKIKELETKLVATQQKISELEEVCQLSNLSKESNEPSKKLQLYKLKKNLQNSEPNNEALLSLKVLEKEHEIFMISYEEMKNQLEQMKEFNEFLQKKERYQQNATEGGIVDYAFLSQTQKELAALRLLEEEIAVHEERAAQSEGEAIRLKHLKETAEEKIASLTQEYEQVHNLYMEQEKHKIDIERAFIEKDKENALLNEQATKLIENITDNKIQLQLFSDKYNDMVKENQEISQILSTQEKEKLQLEREIDRLCKIIEDKGLQNQLILEQNARNELRQILLEKDSEIIEQKDEIFRLTKTNEAIIQENQTLKEQCEAQERALREFENAMDEKELGNLKLKQEVQTMINLMESAKTERLSRKVDQKTTYSQTDEELEETYNAWREKLSTDIHKLKQQFFELSSLKQQEEQIYNNHVAKHKEKIKEILEEKKQLVSEVKELKKLLKKMKSLKKGHEKNNTTPHMGGPLQAVTQQESLSTHEHVHPETDDKLDSALIDTKELQEVEPIIIKSDAPENILTHNNSAINESIITENNSIEPHDQDMNDYSSFKEEVIESQGQDLEMSPLISETLPTEKNDNIDRALSPSQEMVDDTITGDAQHELTREEKNTDTSNGEESAQPETADSLEVTNTHTDTTELQEIEPIITKSDTPGDILDLHEDTVTNEDSYITENNVMDSHIIDLNEDADIKENNVDDTHGINQTAVQDTFSDDTKNDSMHIEESMAENDSIVENGQHDATANVMLETNNIKGTKADNTSTSYEEQHEPNQNPCIDNQLIIDLEDTNITNRDQPLTDNSIPCETTATEIIENTTVFTESSSMKEANTTFTESVDVESDEFKSVDPTQEPHLTEENVIQAVSQEDKSIETNGSQSELLSTINEDITDIETREVSDTTTVDTLENPIYTSENNLESSATINQDVPNIDEEHGQENTIPQSEAQESRDIALSESQLEEESHNFEIVNASKDIFENDSAPKHSETRDQIEDQQISTEKMNTQVNIEETSLNHIGQQTNEVENETLTRSENTDLIDGSSSTQLIHTSHYEACLNIENVPESADDENSSVIVDDSIANTLSIGYQSTNEEDVGDDESEGNSEYVFSPIQPSRRDAPYDDDFLEAIQHLENMSSRIAQESISFSLSEDALQKKEEDRDGKKLSHDEMKDDMHLGNDATAAMVSENRRSLEIVHDHITVGHVDDTQESESEKPNTLLCDQDTPITTLEEDHAKVKTQVISHHQEDLVLPHLKDELTNTFQIKLQDHVIQSEFNTTEPTRTIEQRKGSIENINMSTSFDNNDSLNTSSSSTFFITPTKVLLQDSCVGTPVSDMKEVGVETEEHSLTPPNVVKFENRLNERIKEYEDDERDYFLNIPLPKTATRQVYYYERKYLYLKMRYRQMLEELVKFELGCRHYKHNAAVLKGDLERTKKTLIALNKEKHLKEQALLYKISLLSTKLKRTRQLLDKYTHCGGQVL
ncbi:hypothetical protein FDP41_004929 [Naegleria fowleri]|uniref:Uncharacterized protein n=1 Tax=Naegleria fowleri TaxID=5763 RepID=A0A6A5BQ54_NAEFO|nr:uncharacterized protein FDP41_004929 [Naegleria fowleri]KAF0976254.1 hypothetical protein FDP41_004929 [Naegleria fowleri]